MGICQHTSFYDGITILQKHESFFILAYAHSYWGLFHFRHGLHAQYGHTIKNQLNNIGRLWQLLQFIQVGGLYTVDSFLCFV